MPTARAAAHARAAALKALIVAAQPPGAPPPAHRRPAAPAPAPIPAAPAPRRRLPPRTLLRIGERLRKAGGELHALLATGLELAEVNLAFVAAVRAPLGEHARVARLDPAGWVILVDSPAWASRLRFGIKAVRRGLEARLRRPVPELEVRVEPAALPPPPRPAPRPIAVSDNTARVLASAAAGIDDPALAAALQRLARHARARAGR